MKQIYEAEVVEMLQNGSGVLVDTRSSHAFIGWKMEGEPKEGQIKGATDFSADWLTAGQQPELGVWLYEKLSFRKITSSTKVVLYDYTGKHAGAVEAYMRTQGIEDISYFCLKDWNGEMEYYPEYWRLVPPCWVKDLIEGKNPEHYIGKGFKIFHTYWGPTDERYLDGHIPGAVHIDTEEFEVGPEWIRTPDEELEKFAFANGITTDTTVIIYGDGDAKLNTVLQYMGVERVCLINGGFRAWVRAGYPLETIDNPKESVECFGAKVPAKPDFIMDIDEVKSILLDGAKGAVYDIRTWSQFIGADSGYEYVFKAGRLPNSIWCFDPHFYTNPDGTMENKEEMLELWRKRGVDFSVRNGFFCGSASWGGARIEIYAQVAGIPNILMYEGGWVQWQLDPNNPYEVGTPEKFQ